MRQQSESHPQSSSGYTHESKESRKQRMDKKRAIRKNKISSISQLNDESIVDKHFLSKEQKIQIQKAKNREAAQRSRDQHRVYVETLEQQNKRLKEQLLQPKYCSKCSKQIEIQPQELIDANLAEIEESRPLQTFVYNQNNQELDEFDSPFIRVNSYEDSSPLKMFLFISMILLGVFLIGSNLETTEGQQMKRDLMEISIQNNGYKSYQAPSAIQQKSQRKNKMDSIAQIKKIDLINQIENTLKMDNTKQQNKVINQVVPLTYQLSPFSQQNCIKSIINQNYTLQIFNYPTAPQFVRSGSPYLRSSQHHQMEVFSPKPKQKRDDILFCSLPKLYKSGEEVQPGFLSKFIDIIISGSEMMQVVGKSPNLWMNKVINFNGLYKINAEVKEIVQIKDTNCIL